MRRLADQLVSIAADWHHWRPHPLEGGQHRVRGPAARRFRDWAATERQDAQAVVTKLNDLATYLRREADPLDTRARQAGSPV